jgi:hypothetical protein
MTRIFCVGKRRAYKGTVLLDFSALVFCIAPPGPTRHAYQQFIFFYFICRDIHLFCALLVSTTPASDAITVLER